MRSPMAFVAMALIAGILLGWGLHPSPWVHSAAVLLITVVWGCGRRSAGWANLCLLMLLVIAGAFRVAVDGNGPPQEGASSAAPVALEGTLVSDPALGRNGRVITAWFCAEARGGTSSSAGRRTDSLRRLIQVRLPSRAGRFEVGDRLRLHGLLRPGHAAQPEQGRHFDERQWLWVHGADGVLAVSDSEGIIRLGQDTGIGTRYRRWVGRLKLALAQQGRTWLGSAEAGMLEGLLLGEGRGIRPEVWETFRKTGTVHVLVVSGTHVGLVALISLAFLVLMGTPRVARYLLLTGVLLTYCLLTGIQPPIVRATITGLLLCWGRIRGLEISPLNLLGTAAAGMLALQPRALADASFQLSFAAVAGLLLASFVLSIVEARTVRPSTSSGRAIFHRVAQALAVSCGACAATAPLVAWHFHTFSLITPLANLVVVPWASLLIVIGFLLCGAGLLAPWAAGPFAAAFSLTVRGLTAVVAWMAGCPKISWSWGL